MAQKDLKAILKSRSFLNVATCDLENNPNLAPKLLLRVEKDVIYLGDYVIGRTFRNLKINPRVSLGFMDGENLIGYQFNGRVEIIDSGMVYERMLDELSKKEIELSAQRIIEGIDQGKKHSAFEMEISQTVVILKVKVEEVVEISASEQLRRERL